MTEYICLDCEYLFKPVRKINNKFTICPKCKSDNTEEVFLCGDEVEYD